MNREKKAITVALYGLLIALAMVLSFVETMIPIPIPVPGIKLGLANLVTVVGLYLIGIPGTIAVSLIRIVLVGLSFGNPFSMIFGLSGSFLSLFVMAVLKETGKLSQVSISVVGVILKAMCYYPVSVQWGKWIEQPTPEQVTKIIDTILESHSGDVNILFTSKDVLLQFGWDCLNINIYNPDEEMCMLFEKIAASEGLFWRKSE